MVVLLWEEACGSLHLGNLEGERLPLKRQVGTRWGTRWGKAWDSALRSPRLLHPQDAGQPEHSANWLPGLASVGPTILLNQER